MPERSVLSADVRSLPEVRLLVSCTRTRVTGEFSDRIRTAVDSEVNWMALIRLALRHDVMPLLFRNLQRVCPDRVPKSIFGPLAARYQEQTIEARLRAEELARIMPQFQEQGIPAVPYKGPTLAQRLYGDLSLREFGDLDIMILERDIPRAQSLIRRNGYRFAYLKDEGKLPQYVRAHRELQFCRADGRMLELHWRFAMREACVKDDPERFLKRFEMISLAGAPVPSLPLEVYLLVLALHATKHKWRQLKLICDIAEILGRPGLDWPYVLRESEDLGLKRMLAVGVLLAQDPMGVPAPAELVQGLKIDRAAQALAVEIRQSLFEEPEANWHQQADFRFQLKIRERLQDKASMFFWNCWPRITRPFMAMPDWQT
jgi:hypothetical protein